MENGLLTVDTLAGDLTLLLFDLVAFEVDEDIPPQIFFDLLNVPSLHINLPSEVQAFIPPLLPEQGVLRAWAVDKPTSKAIDNTANFFIITFPF